MNIKSHLSAAALSVALSASGASYLAYVGTYTGPDSKGIYAYRVHGSDGIIEELGLVAETPNPTFLALHPKGHFLYAANEIADFQGTKAGSITAYRIDRATGKLTRINAASTTGGGPCHLNVDATGRQVIFANYGGGSVGSLPINDDGSLAPSGTFFQHRGSSVNPNRQREPHAHSVNFSPDNRFAMACDLGTDEVRVYRFEPTRGLVAAPELTAKTTPGNGPRHLTFGPDGRHVYVNNEMASSVSVFSFDPKAGKLQLGTTLSTLPAGFAGDSSTAEVRTSQDGHWLWVSNRGHNSLARFRIAPGSGALTPAGHVATGGRIPRNFSPTPDGRRLWAANQDSNNIAIFSIDPGTGELTPTGQDLKVGRPVCVRFLVIE